MVTGFIGLGNLGKAIAQRLISEGVELIVWNRTIEKAVDLKMPAAESPAQLISRCDMVFLNLADSKAVESVITGQDGLLDGDCADKIIVDTSTNHFAEVIRFYEIFKKKNARYLETPVLGSVVPASQGNLTLLVSGDSDAFEIVHPLLEKFAKKIFFVEQPGMATRMKLINNLVLANLMASLAEALALGERAGLGKEEVLEILAAGAGNSGVLSGKRQKLIQGDFAPHFSSAMMYKDLLYLSDLANTFKRPLFTGGMVRELYVMAYSRHLENLDFSAIYKIMKEF